MTLNLKLKVHRVRLVAAQWIGLFAATLMVPVVVQAETAPTVCPTNYTCSFQSSSTQALVGGTTDGQPQSQVGFLTFDASGNFSGILTGNLNGKVVSNTAVSGTCVSGTSTTLGTLNFNAGLGGSPAASAFVTSPNGIRTDLLFAGSVLTTDTRVIIGVCHGN